MLRKLRAATGPYAQGAKRNQRPQETDGKSWGGSVPEGRIARLPDSPARFVSNTDSSGTISEGHGDVQTHRVFSAGLLKHGLIEI